MPLCCPAVCGEATACFPTAQVLIFAAAQRHRANPPFPVLWLAARISPISGPRSVAWPTTVPGTRSVAVLTPVPRSAAWPTPVSCFSLGHFCSLVCGTADTSQWFPVGVPADTSQWFLVGVSADIRLWFSSQVPRPTSDCGFLLAAQRRPVPAPWLAARPTLASGSQLAS